MQGFLDRRQISLKTDKCSNGWKYSFARKKNSEVRQKTGVAVPSTKQARYQPSLNLRSFNFFRRDLTVILSFHLLPLNLIRAKIKAELLFLGHKIRYLQSTVKRSHAIFTAASKKSKCS